MTRAEEFARSCGACPIACTQPYGADFNTVDGIFIRQMHLDDLGTIVPQHIHRYDHTTMVATGAVRLWIDEELQGDYVAPAAIFIAAGKPHIFQSLQSDTLLYCIHNLHGASAPAIEKEV